MKILHEKPPVFERALEKFGPIVHGAIFCWGDVIYNPSRAPIPDHLIEHEKIHSEQQKNFAGGVETWWEKYLNDPSFRLSQEIPAHQKEYEAYCSSGKIRNERRVYLKMIAARLSGRLYGNLISFEKAKALCVQTSHEKENAQNP